MVPLGIGQAILGGRSDEEYQAKIYYITCFQQMWQTLNMLIL